MSGSVGKRSVGLVGGVFFGVGGSDGDSKEQERDRQRKWVAERKMRRAKNNTMPREYLRRVDKTNEPLVLLSIGTTAIGINVEVFRERKVGAVGTCLIPSSTFP